MQLINERAMMQECLRFTGVREVTVAAVMHLIPDARAIVYLAERLLENPRMSEGELLTTAIEATA